MHLEQRERLLAFIDNYWDEKWTSPTVREIGRFMGWSSSATAHGELLKLVRRGQLEVRRSGKRVLYRRPQ